MPVTNAIESLNMQSLKIIKTRGHFPTDEATIKLLWLALRNVLAKSVRATFDGEAAMNQFATCSANGLLRRGVRAYPTTPIPPSVQLIPYCPHERLHHAGAKQARASRQLTLFHHCALAHHSCTLAPRRDSGTRSKGRIFNCAALHLKNSQNESSIHQGLGTPLAQRADTLSRNTHTP